MILSIDTCGVTGSIALGRREGRAVTVLAQLKLAGRSYSARLVPTMGELLAGQEAALAGIEAIVVVNGPGSFTGIRIGVATAKAMAEVLAVPILAVSRLRVLAHKAAAAGAMIDAGRGEFYSLMAGREMLLAREAIPVADAGSLAAFEESVRRAFPAAMLTETPDAADALAFAAPRLQGSFDDVALLDGNYVRRSDAELFAAGKLR
jgi:tRNA threonylcarbamoyladenosine biosynthesis protein TsaB